MYGAFYVVTRVRFWFEISDDIVVTRSRRRIYSSRSHGKVAGRDPFCQAERFNRNSSAYWTSGPTNSINTRPESYRFLIKRHAIAVMGRSTVSYRSPR